VIQTTDLNTEQKRWSSPASSCHKSCTQSNPTTTEVSRLHTI